mmetsp:Transcript_56847/g.133842  ORF Transcript_56847/g.133842 Transcript_56847/m.133842 type:complete len:220 (+) Transcript_56847:471-1130(+)
MVAVGVRGRWGTATWQRARLWVAGELCSSPMRRRQDTLKCLLESSAHVGHRTSLPHLVKFVRHPRRTSVVLVDHGEVGHALEGGQRAELLGRGDEVGLEELGRRGVVAVLHRRSALPHHLFSWRLPDRRLEPHGRFRHGFLERHGCLGDKTTWATRGWRWWWPVPAHCRKHGILLRLTPLWWGWGWRAAFWHFVVAVWTVPVSSGMVTWPLCCSFCSFS